MKVFVIAAFLFLCTAAGAQNTAADYRKTVTARAEKIVSTLNLTDAAKAARVTTIVADQYVLLNDIYTARDEKIKEAKASQADKEAVVAKVKEAEDAASPRIQQQHDAFLQKLSAELNEEQITRIKDGLTYNVLPITYKAHLEMIPALKPAEKAQIMAWLVEAREQAMSAESSDKKHWWFGKYKGKINNYLAAQGYDLQKERAGWQARIKAGEEQKKETRIQQ